MRHEFTDYLGVSVPVTSIRKWHRRPGPRYTSSRKFGRAERGSTSVRAPRTPPTPESDGSPMRDWLLVILPVALVFYFIEYPDQLKAVIEWLSALARYVQ
jgi:hypothetical protein